MQDESADYQALEMYARARISVEPPQVSPYTQDMSLLGGFLHVSVERPQDSDVFMVQRQNGKKVVTASAPDFKCVCRARRLNAKLMLSVCVCVCVFVAAFLSVLLSFFSFRLRPLRRRSGSP